VVYRSALLDPQVAQQPVERLAVGVVLGVGFYMHSRYDQHPTLKAALVGEPIPPAPDSGGDE
jgi:hypothetical protein